jgi:hypothetical protein
MCTRGACHRRLRPWGGALVLAAVLILPNASAQADAKAKPPKRSDVAAARALVGAQTRYYAAGLATRREAGADANAVIAQVKAQCPHALPGTLVKGGPAQRTVYKQLFTEGAFDVALAELQPVGDATTTEAEALDRIHFSKRAVNRDLRQLASSQRATLTLAPSDLCTNIKTAADGGYVKVPPATTQFINHAENVATGPAPSFNQLVDDVRPDVLTRHERAAVKHMRALGIRYTAFVEGLAFDAASKLADALGETP